MVAHPELNGKNGRTTKAGVNGHQAAAPVLICDCKREIPPNAKFCPYCGFSQGIKTESRLCLNCLTPAEPEWSTCIECGKEIADPTTIDPDGSKKRRDSAKEAAIRKRYRILDTPGQQFNYNYPTIQWELAASALDIAAYVGSLMNGTELLSVFRASSGNSRSPAFVSACLSIFPYPDISDGSDFLIRFKVSATYTEAMMLWLTSTMFAKGWVKAEITPDATENGELFEGIFYTGNAAQFLAATDPSYNDDEDFTFDFAQMWANAYGIYAQGYPPGSYVGDHAPFPLRLVRQRFAAYRADIEAKRAKYANEPDTQTEIVCAVCGTPLDDVTLYCDGCGTLCPPEKTVQTREKSTNSQAVLPPKYCNHCQASIPSGTKHCPKCRGVLVRAFIQEQPVETVKALSLGQRVQVVYHNQFQLLFAWGFCQACGSQVYILQYTVEFCEVCSSALYPNANCRFLPTDDYHLFEKICAAFTDSSSFCSRCSCPIFPDTHFCIRCGVKLPEKVAADQKKTPLALVTCGCMQMVTPDQVRPYVYRCKRGCTSHVGKPETKCCISCGSEFEPLPHRHVCYCGEPIDETGRQGSCCSHCGGLIRNQGQYDHLKKTYSLPPPPPVLRTCNNSLHSCGTKTWDSFWDYCSECNHYLPLTPEWQEYKYLIENNVWLRQGWMCPVCGKTYYSKWELSQKKYCDLCWRGKGQCVQVQDHRTLRDFRNYERATGIMIVPCEACQGTARGIQGGYCLTCNGKGWQWQQKQSNNAREVEGTLTYVDNRTEQRALSVCLSSPCPTCRGTGRTREHIRIFCPECCGTGSSRSLLSDVIGKRRAPLGFQPNR